MHGKGVYKWSNGRKYEGEFLKDKFEGKGTYLFEDGTIYTGQWKDGLQHGKGKIISMNNEV